MFPVVVFDGSGSVLAVDCSVPKIFVDHNSSWNGLDVANVDLNVAVVVCIAGGGGGGKRGGGVTPLQNF